MQHRAVLAIAFADCKAWSMKIDGFEFIINKLLVQLDQSEFRVLRAHQYSLRTHEKGRLSKNLSQLFSCVRYRLALVRDQPTKLKLRRDFILSRLGVRALTAGDAHVPMDSRGGTASVDDEVVALGLTRDRILEGDPQQLVRS
jgi:hypothetical protein